MASVATDVRHFPDRVLLPLEFDAARMAADLAALGDAPWTLHFVPQNFDGDWSAMPLRAPADAEHPIQMIYSRPNARDFADTPMLARAPYLQQVIAAFECPVRCVRLMRLTPGSAIREHCDPDLAPEFGWARIHVPIATNDETTFFLNRIPLWMGPGETWYLRLADPHRVENRGGTDRVHLVLDVEVNDWLVAQLEAGLG